MAAELVLSAALLVGCSGRSGSTATTAAGVPSGSGGVSGSSVIPGGLPVRPDPSTFTRIQVAGDPGPSGIFDPDAFCVSGSRTCYMAYSTGDFHVDAGGQEFHDVNTAIGVSGDSGATWRYIQTVNSTYPLTVDDGSSSMCGAPTCSVRMVSEVPILLHDPTDPDPSARYKLLAFRHAFDPGTQQDIYVMGAVTMRTAPSPDGTWSKEKPEWSWNLSPAQLASPNNLNRINAALANCAVLSEGDALSTQGGIYIALTCAVPSGSDVNYSDVLLRSADHLNTLQYVATIAKPPDVASIAPRGLSALDLVSGAHGTYLLGTVVASDGQYRGCVAIPFGDLPGGKLARDPSGHLAYSVILPTLDNRFGGSCTWDEGITASGILMSELFTENSAPDPFRIFATGVNLG